jgi:hypothetical protein
MVTTCRLAFRALPVRRKKGTSAHRQFSTFARRATKV